MFCGFLAFLIFSQPRIDMKTVIFYSFLIFLSSPVYSQRKNRRQNRRGTLLRSSNSAHLSLDEDGLVTNRIEKGISNVEDYIEDLKDRQDELLQDNSTDTLVQMSRILDATKKLMINKILKDNDIPPIVEHLTSSDEEMIELRSGANPFFDCKYTFQQILYDLL